MMHLFNCKTVQDIFRSRKFIIQAKWEKLFEKLATGMNNERKEYELIPNQNLLARFCVCSGEKRKYDSDFWKVAPRGYKDSAKLCLSYIFCVAD